MKIKEILDEIVKHSGATDGFDRILALCYQLGMPPPPDEFVKSLITMESPNPDFFEVRSWWIVKWISERVKKEPTTPFSAFVGPCVHGRDPWNRCDECGEGTEVQAAVKVINSLTKKVREFESYRQNGMIARDMKAKKWIREAYRLGQALHLPDCKHLPDSSCTCGLEELLK